MRVWYTTREDVKLALDAKLTARSDSQIDRAIASASTAVEGLCKRKFYPERRTQTWDWPRLEPAFSFRLWLNDDELISLESFTAGGVALTPDQILLRPDHGPPFTYLEVNLGTSGAFSAGTSWQRSLSGVGLYGYRDDRDDAGTLDGAVSSSQTTIACSDSAAIGVGTIILADTERMIVTNKRMADTLQNLSGTITASPADVIVAVTDGTLYTPGEVILLDAERMLIVDIAGNNLIVKRAWDGTVLAAHTNSDIYALRSLVVTRGALGSTAATHTDNTVLSKQVIPELAAEYCAAKAIDTLLQRQAGYGRTVGSGDNEREASGRGLAEIARELFAAHGRKARTRAV